MNFESRHIGPHSSEQSHISRTLGFASNDELLNAAVPASILVTEQLDLPPAVSEHEVLRELRLIAAENTVRRCAIGTGYYPTITPPVILRNVLENPAWYTAYTPYQPEISQGRLEGLLNFQTVVTELTGLDIANASLLDESTAIAEAVTMARRTAKSESRVVAIHDDTHPQHLSVLRARCAPIGVSVEVLPLAALATVDAFCVVVSRPSSSGIVAPDSEVGRVVEAAHARGAIAVCVTDPLASTLLTTPASLGFDIAVGSAQRFGVPMGCGGPHAAFLAATESFARSLPGRLVGVSTDTAGRPSALPRHCWPTLQAFMRRGTVATDCKPLLAESVRTHRPPSRCSSTIVSDPWLKVLVSTRSPSLVSMPPASLPRPCARTSSCAMSTTALSPSASTRRPTRISWWICSRRSA
jgi:glycine dehydrogenase